MSTSVKSRSDRRSVIVSSTPNPANWGPPGELPVSYADRYVLHEYLGRGPDTKTYIAEDLESGYYMSLRIPAERVSEQRFATMCETAERVAELTGVAVDRYRLTGERFLARTLVTNSLWDRFLDDDLELAEVFTIAGNLASSIDALAAEGLHHGNVKLSNVLTEVDVDGRTTGYLVDWPGPCAAPLPIPRYVAHNYMAAPEQLLGLAPTAASDQFGLAMIVVAMLSGQESMARLLASIRVDPAGVEEHVANSVSGYYGPAWSVIATAVAPDHRKRYASCAEFVETLYAVLQKAGCS